MAWLRRKTQVIKESWERILLEELFVFSGGLEGAWVTSSGWVSGKELQQNNDRAGVSYRQGRVSNLYRVIGQRAAVGNTGCVARALADICRLR